MNLLPPGAEYAGQIQLPTGPVVVVRVVSSRCLHCNNHIVGDIQHFALGPPYCGVLHLACAPFYAYPAVWPHPKPAIGFSQS